jgi:tRNA-dihydrouridine synthase B
MKGPRIGDLELENPLILAPMAGITDSAFRLIAKRHGAALVFSEMVSSIALTRGGDKSFDMIRATPQERPFGVQIEGPDPDSMAEAARIAQDYCDLIDLNFGCPVRKVVAEPTPAGAGLLKYPDRIERIIRAVVKVSTKPVTVKIRSGWDHRSINAAQIAKIAEDSGVSAITLHPRTRKQGFSGRADWSLIAKVKGTVSIPVIGNGDVFEPQDAKRMMDLTGCDGVMIGRGTLGNPWIFSRTLKFLETGEIPPEPSPEEKLETLLELMKLMVKFKGEERATLEIRKHVGWFLKGLPHTKATRVKGQQIKSYSELEDLLRGYLERYKAGQANRSASS